MKGLCLVCSLVACVALAQGPHCENQRPPVSSPATYVDPVAPVLPYEPVPGDPAADLIPDLAPELPVAEAPVEGPQRSVVKHRGFVRGQPVRNAMCGVGRVVWRIFHPFAGRR